MIEHAKEHRIIHIEGPGGSGLQIDLVGQFPVACFIGITIEDRNPVWIDGFDKNFPKLPCGSGHISYSPCFAVSLGTKMVGSEITADPRGNGALYTADLPGKVCLGFLWFIALFTNHVRQFVTFIFRIRRPIGFFKNI